MVWWLSQAVLWMQCLLKQMPRLLDRLDEIGLPRVDGRVLWSRVLLGHTMQDQAPLDPTPLQTLSHTRLPLMR
jgi:hypothetical protein